MREVSVHYKQRDAMDRPAIVFDVSDEVAKSFVEIIRGASEPTLYIAFQTETGGSVIVETANIAAITIAHSGRERVSR